MANTFSGPIVLDTADSGPVKPGDLHVHAILFHGYGTAGDEAVIEDSDSRVVFRLVGDADLLPQFLSFSYPVRIRGLALTALDSGEVVIYTK